MLGIGAVIGAGIFSSIGTAAAGEAADGRAVRRRPGPHPLLPVLAVVCALAALCYAELAAMVPIAGSAYTYAYATLGELVAWIIGWDLILEYAVGNVAVAISWSGYFASLPARRSGSTSRSGSRTATGRAALRPGARRATAATSSGIPSLVNLPGVRDRRPDHRACW